MKGSFVFGWIFLVGAGLSACSARIEGAAKNNPAPAKVTEHQVPGPAVDGTWKSDCHYNYTSGRYEVVTMTISGQQVSRKQEKFADSVCKNTIKLDEWNGIFRFMKKYGEDIYEVEYQIDLGQGATQYTGENIKLVKTKTSSTLWISEYYVGEAGSPSLALKQ